MKLDPGIHIVKHVVFFGKSGVTAKEHTTDSNTDAEINTKKAHISTEPAANDVASKLHTPKHHRICHTAESHHVRGVWGRKPTKIQQTNATRSSMGTFYSPWTGTKRRSFSFADAAAEPVASAPLAADQE
jgi:hypothetical protein